MLVTLAFPDVLNEGMRHNGRLRITRCFIDHVGVNFEVWAFKVAWLSAKGEKDSFQFLEIPLRRR